ncbi:hypothetical protein PR048_031093 [Dryococelus australis]|uniref:Uncharacterized protein n=1 Tax=Dryococelus australis TaxID=614101 RepID=A0ABQ9G4A8_9NEOP|nr:hypothetical protein PR048_031093 [Dryococelus australis]
MQSNTPLPGADESRQRISQHSLRRKLGDVFHGYRSTSRERGRDLTFIGAAVAERLACSPPTMANRVLSPAGRVQSPPALHFGAASYSPLSPSPALKTSLQHFNARRHGRAPERHTFRATADKKLGSSATSVRTQENIDRTRLMLTVTGLSREALKVAPDGVEVCKDKEMALPDMELRSLHRQPYNKTASVLVHNNTVQLQARGALLEMRWGGAKAGVAIWAGPQLDSPTGWGVGGESPTERWGDTSLRQGACAHCCQHDRHSFPHTTASFKPPATLAAGTEPVLPTATRLYWFVFPWPPRRYVARFIYGRPGCPRCQLRARRQDGRGVQALGRARAVCQQEALQPVEAGSGSRMPTTTFPSGANLLLDYRPPPAVLRTATRVGFQVL